MCNPIASRHEKQKTFESIAKKQNYGELTKNLFGTYIFLQCLFFTTNNNTKLFSCLGAIAEHSRFGKMEAILKSFAVLMSAHRGEVQCEVTTAKVFSLVFCSK